MRYKHKTHAKHKYEKHQHSKHSNEKHTKLSIASSCRVPHPGLGATPTRSHLRELRVAVSLHFALILRSRGFLFR